MIAFVFTGRIPLFRLVVVNYEIVYEELATPNFSNRWQRIQKEFHSKSSSCGMTTAGCPGVEIRSLISSEHCLFQSFEQFVLLITFPCADKSKISSKNFCYEEKRTLQKDYFNFDFVEISHFPFGMLFLLKRKRRNFRNKKEILFCVVISRSHSYEAKTFFIIFRGVSLCRKNIFYVPCKYNLLKVLMNFCLIGATTYFNPS